ncbi:cinnamoyl-CoA reductase-like SNL6 [Diospyros lotus]|uniref:cinnamoyl-CoA reductase-like SNL6 n=1 Tax=Diospyros lotus TaxID=55363 RepID=UPI0022547988|nr:cinnamoyl-CoA reductase-like SNL6 [Diospyros lotus]
MAPAAAAAFFQTSINAVCVMDANGRLGCGLVEQLLRRGYEVHAAIQSPKESQTLKKLACDNQNLKIFHSDPFDYQSIVDALKGCTGLFYNFEPPEDYPTYDEFMAEIEARAAHNVLEACAQTETIDKVVFTSSATAVIWREDRKSSQLSDFDETHWTDINLCRKFKLWHALSKTLAEKAAWSLAMDRGVSMVCVNAGLLMGGPDLTITNPYLKGAAEMYEDGVFVTVDLDFLVDAHICVFEDVASYGRYLCFNHVISTNEDAAKLAQMLCPDSPQPPPSYEEDMRIIQQKISNKKLNKLMVDFEGGATEDRF